MRVRVKRLSDLAVMPRKAHPSDAGFDLTATWMESDKYGNMVYHTDLAFEIPEGYAGFIYPRSSVSKKDMILTNCVGVIDSHYRGEVTFKFKPMDEFESCEVETSKDGNLIARAYGGFVVGAGDDSIQYCHIYKAGERIGQMIIMPIPEIEFEESDSLTDTDRGEGGYGSTGL